jgi:NAD-dependent DNA ligase
MTLEGYKEKSVDNLLQAIENKRTLPVEKLIASLGIP